MELPPPIAAYFAAGRSGDAGALERSFTADAVMRDEGAVHTGPAAIGAQWQAARQKYRHTIEVLGVREQANLPGTVEEQPNWRRKLPLTLGEIEHDERFIRLADSLSQIRGAGRR